MTKASFPRMRRGLMVALCLLLLLPVVCVLLPRYPAVAPGHDPYAVEKLAEQIDPWLLGEGFSERTVIEIDWVEGCRPGPQTVGGLDATLRKYGPPHHPIEVVQDQEIPLLEWNQLSSERDRVDRLVQEYAGVERASTPGTEWRYVLFAPDAEGYFGHVFTSLLERGGVTTQVSGLIVSRSAHRPYAKLWISLDRLERMTLIHEFGHLLGLVGNPRHERKDPAHRNHCTSLTCAMAHPTPRVIARNAFAGVFNQLITDYCADCQADIRRAQAYWHDRETEGSAYRERRQRERGARAAALSIQTLVENKHDADMLERVHELRSAWPEYPGWDELEAQALIGLDRTDEALVFQLRALPTDLAAPTYWRSRWVLDRLYVGVGRYDAAIALFDRAALASAEEYEFEQSAILLDQALSSCGRYDEAVALLDDLLARGKPVSFWPERMRTRRAALLRRAGRMKEADDAVSRALDDRRRRAIWLEQAARLRHAQDRTADERALWQELLQGAETGLLAAKDAPERTALEWSAVQCLARFGQIDEARRRAASVEAAVDGAAEPRSRLEAELSARAALGDWNTVAELIRAVPIVERAYASPCQLEDLAPMREIPAYDDLFRLCPHRTDRATGVH